MLKIKKQIIVIKLLIQILTNENNKIGFDEKKLNEIIQSKLDKAMLDPAIASKWLQTRNKEKE